MITGKKEARKYYTDIRKNISENRRKEASSQVCKEIGALIERECYDAVLMYAPLFFEVDVLPIFDNFEKVCFYFPKTGKDSMEFYRVEKLCQLKNGNFNVMEPDDECEIIDLGKKKVLMIVPGIAFDKRGYRLGYGKGYYDKYLSLNKSENIFKVGVCFKECMSQKLSDDEYDIPVDKVIFA